MGSDYSVRNGYDFILNRVTPNGRKSILEKSVKGVWTWEAADRCKFFSKGNKLAIRIPREALGIADGTVDLEFKWNDNMQEEGDIIDFYVNGDTAPGGRFNFVYKTE